MDKTGIALGVLTVAYGAYIAVALLLARVRDSRRRARASDYRLRVDDTA